TGYLFVFFTVLSKNLQAGQMSPNFFDILLIMIGITQAQLVS
ncbi:MAG: hypothetical protein ACI9LE_000695, partial [Paraglaciecola sp.]